MIWFLNETLLPSLLQISMWILSGAFWSNRKDKIFFFNCYLAAPRPTLGHYRGGSLTHTMLITCVLHIRPEGNREPRNEVGSLSPAEHLVGFEPGIFPFWWQRLDPLGHSLHLVAYLVTMVTRLYLDKGFFPNSFWNKNIWNSLRHF